MKINRQFLANIVLALVVSSAVFICCYQGFFRRLELAGFDFVFNTRGAIPFDPRIIIVEISDSEIEKVGRWPWERKWMASIVMALKELGAGSIYLDILFSETGGQDDVLLEAAIREAGNVYLPFVFRRKDLDISTALLALDRFRPYIKGTGAINIYPDPDGAIRRLRPVFKHGHDINEHIAFKIALDEAGLKISGIQKSKILLSGSGRDIAVPIGEDANMVINWSGTWKKTFRHYGFLDVLSAYKDLKDGVKPGIDTSVFRNSICLVGVTAIGLYDIKPIPFEPEYPSIGAIANVISSVLRRDFLTPLPSGLNFFIIYLLGLLPAFFVAKTRSLLKSAIFIFSLGAGFVIISYILFTKGYILNFTCGLLSIAFSTIAIETYHFIRVSQEKQKLFKLSITDGLTGLYNIRYFKMLLETEIMLAKPNPDASFCIIMSDVDHFKKFNDTYGHQVGDLVLKETAQVIKGCIRSSDIAARYGGEENIVLLRSTTLANGMMIAEKIRKAIEEHILKDENNTYRVTVSLGVSLYSKADDVETIIKRADSGLYKAKEFGRNRVCTLEAT